MAGTSFDRVAHVYDETRGGERRGHGIAAGLLPYLVHGRVLEVGVGTGIVGVGLRERGVDLVGVDLAPAMLTRAVERLGPCVARADAERLPVPDASLGVALFVWVLHLVPDIAGALAEAARVLRPGGRVVAVPSGAIRHDEAHAIVQRMHEAVGIRPGSHADAIEAAGLTVPTLRHVATDLALHQPHELCPARQAREIEDRQYSSLFDIDDERWQRHVVPAIAALRALPDADETRQVESHQHVTVFERI